MRVIEARNVNDALFEGVKLLNRSGVPVRNSRAGRVVEWPTPVATVYRRPWERVLWSEDRDANPFFHFLEAMWMLNGGKDVAFPAMLLERMRDYSDDGKVMQGAYGWRWREWFGYDQIEFIIKLLREDPGTRRAVLTMWEPGDLSDRLLSKDVPCNTHIYFKVRDDVLHMTVCNRSNDILWGAYGANAVHMSFLHEYVAARAGFKQGTYTQISDSYHVYLDGPGGKVWERVTDRMFALMDYEGYTTGRVPVTPMNALEAGWMADMAHFFNTFAAGENYDLRNFRTYWWRRVVHPIYAAYIQRDPGRLEECGAVDWRLAGKAWLRRHAR